jgi:hypothetical protein
MSAHTALIRFITDLHSVEHSRQPLSIRHHDIPEFDLSAFWPRCRRFRLGNDMRSFLGQFLRSIVENSFHRLFDAKVKFRVSAYPEVSLTFMLFSNSALCLVIMPNIWTRDVRSTRTRISEVRGHNSFNAQVSAKPITAGLSVVFVADMMATQNIRIAPQKSRRIASHR